MDIYAWLRALGLGQYEAAFRDNAIDERVLPGLTSEDLREMGVAPIGHRRLILDAASALRIAANREPATSQDAQAPVSGPAAPTYDGAERRPLTVMFCDLVDSTSLAATLDAEDWRELVSAYLDEASKAVTGYGGHVLKKLGDGLMALFGYPKAQENDAERAARAGLAILRALDEMNARNVARGLPPLAARIGLETGPVVVDAKGEVFGDAPNVAARVQSAAEPGTLLITASVQRQVAGLFVAEDKGPHALKGVPGSRTLYRLVRASGAGRRSRPRSPTPLIGRREELSALARRWERARAGDGQFVLITGEPGLGKTRLLEEFRICVGETPHTWVEFAASQLLQNTPLHPVAEWGRQRFAAEAKFAELYTVLAQLKLDPSEYAPLLAPLLDISAPDGPSPQGTADEFRRMQLSAVVALVLAGARAQPLVLAFEDLHWADPTSLDLMAALAEGGGQAPLFIIATARPEFRATWAPAAHHDVISLTPLDRAQIGQMAGAIAEGHTLSRDAVEGLCERTGGVPLFIEELTRLMLEGGTENIPPTLQQLLAARLDRLGDAREVAQIGAVLGREFSRALLKAVTDASDATLDDALERLSDAGLLFIEGGAPQEIYRFKHALIQDAAYESLLRSRRRELHRRAAEALRDSLSDATAPETVALWEMIARHFGLADLGHEAACAWHEAGMKAAREGAHREAEKDFQLALESLYKLDDTPERTLFKLTVETDLCAALQVTEGYSAARTVEAMDRIKSLSDKVGSIEHSIAQTSGRWAILSSAGRYLEAARLSSQFFTLAAADGREETAALAHMIGMTSCFRLGDVVGAESHYVAGKEQFTSEAFTRRPGVVGQLFGNASQTAWMLGRAGEAWERMKLALKLTENTNSPYDQTFTYFMAAMLAALMREPRQAIAFAQPSLDLADKYGFPQFAASARIVLGRAQAEIYDSKNEALDLMATGMARMAETKATVAMTLYLGWQAEAQALAGRLQDALATINRALAFNREERSFLTELLRIRGELRASAGPEDAAEGDMRKALALALKMRAPQLALRAAISLHTYLQRTGRGDARNIVASTLELVRDGADSRDVDDAARLLAGVRTALTIA